MSFSCISFRRLFVCFSSAFISFFCGYIIAIFLRRLYLVNVLFRVVYPIPRNSNAVFVVGLTSPFRSRYFTAHTDKLITPFTCRVVSDGRVCIKSNSNGVAGRQATCIIVLAISANGVTFAVLNFESVIVPTTIFHLIRNNNIKSAEST